MKTLVLANQKGGVGKSAVVCQLAFYLVQIGKRVLVLDFDHQKNSTERLTGSGRVAVTAFSTSDLIAGKAGETPNALFVLVPGDWELLNLERQPANYNDYVNAVARFLDEIDDRFDVCLIDTNPNPDIRYAAALVTADYLLSPIQLTQEAIDGIGALLNDPRYGYRKIKGTVNPKLELIGLLPNLVAPTPFQRANFKDLIAAHAKLLLMTDAKDGKFAFIPQRSAIFEAQAEGVFVGNMKKTAARDAWREIKPTFDAIIERLQLES